MTRPLRRRHWLAAAASLALPGVVARAADAPPLRIGVTPVFLDDRVRLLQRWQAVLQSALGLPVEFVQRATYGQVLDLLRAGEVQFAWICGYPYVLHRRELRLVAVPLWRGRPLYQSYLIADAAGDAASLADLRGRSFAYADPLSNSGFLVVQHRLRSAGHDPARYFGRSFFTHSHRHVVEAVADGLAAGGAVDGYIWDTLAALRPDLTGRTRVIERSRDFGFPPIVAAPQTDPAAVQAFGAALMGMSGSAAGRAVLAELRLDGFTPGSPALFDGIARMAAGVAMPAAAPDGS
jgi:phosphonate transport system substrate-binding protein